MALSGPATRQDFELRGNRDYLLRVPVVGVDGLPYVFGGGDVVNWYFGENRGSPRQTRSTSSNPPITIVGSEVRVPILAADTRGLPPTTPSRRYWHELEIIDSSGNKSTTTEGEVTLISTFDDS